MWQITYAPVQSAADIGYLTYNGYEPFGVGVMPYFDQAESKIIEPNQKAKMLPCVFFRRPAGTRTVDVAMLEPVPRESKDEQENKA
jgi:hypothetical protein